MAMMNQRGGAKANAQAGNHHAYCQQVRRGVPLLSTGPDQHVDRIAVVLANLASNQEREEFIRELGAFSSPASLPAAVLARVNRMPPMAKMTVYTTWGSMGGGNAMGGRGGGRGRGAVIRQDTSGSTTPHIPQTGGHGGGGLMGLLSMLSQTQQQQQQQQSQQQQQEPQPQHHQQQPYQQGHRQPQYAFRGDDTQSSAGNDLPGLVGAFNKFLSTATSSPTPTQEEKPVFNERLSTDQLRAFQRDGFLRIEDVVPQNLRDRALAAINQRIGKGIDKDKSAAFNAVRGGLGYWPELAHTEIIMDLLYKSPLIAYISHLIGKPHRCHMGQIALRFPGHSCLHKQDHSDIHNLIQLGKAVDNVFTSTNSSSLVAQHVDQHSHNTDFIVPAKWKEFWHIDGVPNSHNAGLVPAGSIMQFTLLVGVLLSDVTKPLCGNFTAFPGSHLTIEQQINKHGLDPREVLLTSSSAESAVPSISFPSPPQQLTGRAGDVFLVHYQTAHTYLRLIVLTRFLKVAPNASENIRYAIFFRLHHIDRELGKYRPAAMKDVWLEYDSIRALD